LEFSFGITARWVGIVKDIGTTPRIDGIISLANRCRDTAWLKQHLKASVDIRKEVLCLLGMPFVRRYFQGVNKSRIEVMHEDQSMEEVYEWVF
jgi:hypothetical protein